MRHVEQLENRWLFSTFTAASVAELLADMNAANAAGGSNTITLAAGTTFRIHDVDMTPAAIYLGPTGLPTIDSFNDLTIIGNGDVIERSGRSAFRLFSVVGSLTLNDLTLSHGLATDISPLGGAIFSEGTLSLNHVTVQDSIAQGPTATAGLGGGIYSSGALTIADSTIKNNQALGGDGQNTGSPGGWAAGGGVFIAGGIVNVSNTMIASNVARGGTGANGGKGGEFGYLPGGDGGAGLGGAIYTAAGTVELRGNTITQNIAQGGAAGNTRKGYSSLIAPPGHVGVGQGGGIYINSGASLSLDAFTQAHTSGNTASTSDNDIFGSFTFLG